MHGLYIFLRNSCTCTTFNRFSRFTKFSTKKVVFFARGPPGEFEKFSQITPYFFVLKHQISGTTYKNHRMYPPLFLKKKVNHFGKFFRGNFIYISQTCTTMRILTFYTMFTFKKKNIFRDVFFLGTLHVLSQIFG